MLRSIPRGLAVAGLTAAALAVPMTGAATAAPHDHAHTAMCHAHSTHARCHHTQGRHHGHGGSSGESRRDHLRRDDDYGRRGDHRRYDDDDHGSRGDDGGRRSDDEGRRGGDDEGRGGEDEGRGNDRGSDRGHREDLARPEAAEGNGLGRDGLLGLGVLGVL
ncbi:hypothetical protein [Streptomyces sp. YGL11-2]|uniref:hypothetical protein n=1 Tax=Streptomyces sp. YGL11-2 TaxID=3414028 RepID=UPI003CEDED42